MPRPSDPVNLDAVRRQRALDTLARLQALAAAAATEEEAREVAAQIRAFTRRIRAARWEPYVWQHPHQHPEGWESTLAPGVCDDRCAGYPPAVPGIHQAWLQRGGRGTGKTEGAAHYVNAHAEGPACDLRAPGGHRFTIVAPTQPDAVSSCVTGVSGLQAINPGITVTTTKEGTLVRWPNGTVGRVLGAHEAKDVERARAWTNVCLWWLEEAAAQNHLGGMLEQAPFTLRLGERPHMVVTTTPKNRPEVKALIDGDPDYPHIPRAVVQTWGRTEDADRLPAPIRASYESMFRGTTLGRQELDGELLADVAGALWVMDRPDIVDGAPNKDDRPGINQTRLPAGSVGWTPHTDAPVHCPPPESPTLMAQQTFVGVDPPGGRTEAGIIGIGVINRHGYVLADLSIAAGPATWGRRAVQMYLDLGADGIVLEKTYGGDQTVHVIETAAEAMDVPCPPILKAPTKVGKRLRAEPVVAVYQQRRMHHVGSFPLLEGEQTTWVEDESPESPNRIDALVHAASHALIRVRAASTSKATGRRVPSTSAAPTQGRPTPWGTRRQG